MKTAILTPNGFVIKDMGMPQIGKDEILVKTKACGVCRGDVVVYQNRKTQAGEALRLGHEASGEVLEVGEHVTSFKPGNLVTALTVPAYAEYFAAKSTELVRLPEGVDPTFALGEAIACCVHAANRFGIRPGDRVAVVGVGFMGLVCLQLAKGQRAGLICALDPVAERRALSEDFGAAATYNPQQKDADEIVAAHGAFDVVIEAAGTQGAIDLCTDLVAQHGRVILVGYHQSNGGVRRVDMQRWNYKAIDVINGHVRRQDEKLEAMREGMELLQRGHIRTAPLVTVYEFAEMGQAFLDLDAGKPGLYKAVLQMGDR